MTLLKTENVVVKRVIFHLLHHLRREKVQVVHVAACCLFSFNRQHFIVEKVHNSYQNLNVLELIKGEKAFAPIDKLKQAFF